MPDEPTLGEVARQIESLRIDVRLALDERLRADVYRAEQRAAEERIHAIETRIALSEEDRRRLRGAVIGAAVTAGLSVLVNIISGFVQGMGH